MAAPATEATSAPAADDQKTLICVGTRKSALALKQAEFVISKLTALHPGHRFEVRGRDAAADIDKVTALYKFGGTGLWTNELEAELVSRRVDFVVHSLKDMPTNLPEGCQLACVTEREDPRDTLVLKSSLAAQGGIAGLADLPAGAVVGTSSVRRMAQVRRRFPHLRFEDVRGNIDTRLRKLDDPEGPFSALILAAAGLRRMGQDARITQFLDSNTPGGAILHAVGQGGLGIEALSADEPTLALLRALEDPRAMLRCEAERSLMRTLEGGCSVPIGVETRWLGGSEGEDGQGAGDTLRFTATVVSVDGTESVDAQLDAEVRSREDAVAAGKALAQQLRDRGAQKILDVIIADREVNPPKWQPA